MQSISATIRQKWFWVCQSKPLWIHVLLTVITGLVLYIKPAFVNGQPTDLPVRFWGMWLQLIGAYTVWVDLTGTAKDFGAEHFNTWEAVKNIFRTLPPITGSATAMLEGVEAVASVGTVTAIGDQPTLENRIAALEKQAAGLTEQLIVVRQQLASQEDSIRTDLQKLETELAEAIRVLSEQIKSAI